MNEKEGNIYSDWLYPRDYHWAWLMNYSSHELEQLIEKNKYEEHISLLWDKERIKLTSEVNQFLEEEADDSELRSKVFYMIHAFIGIFFKNNLIQVLNSGINSINLVNFKNEIMEIISREIKSWLGEARIVKMTSKNFGSVKYWT